MSNSTIGTKVVRSPEVEDVQNSPDNREIPINQVGIKDLKHPIRVTDRNGTPQPTIATFNMYVNLDHSVKGTHMSRFVDILNEDSQELSIKSFRDLLAAMTKRLEAERGMIEVDFPYFIKKAAPVSKVESLLDYQVSLIGEFGPGQCKMLIKVVVPVTSLCPCSKKISDYGAHNQRSHVTVTAQTDGFLWIEDLIELVEKEASCELYGLLKRPDEKYVTERAYDNPKFVEDMVRDVAAQLNRDERVLAYRVESENFESIHNHSAYAQIEKNMS